VNEPQRDRQRKSLSPWGELYGQLLRAESIDHRRTPAQHAASTRLRAEQAVRALTAAHTTNKERRDRVLRHPDLAQRLCDVLGIADAARWNGYVPPAEVPGGAVLARSGQDRLRRTAVLDGEPYYVVNTSPVRAALVRICREAYLRENPEQADQDADPGVV
jgi:hypothetical protein